MIDRATLGAALAAWTRAIGADFVETDRTATAAAERATYPTEEGVAAILRPADRDEVRACLRIAGTFSVPVYPVSTGRNWGYGSRVPTLDGCVLVDLSRLNRILEVDEDLAYVVLEPGVTQGMLDAHLREVAGGRLWLDATSSSADCSVIGNLLERGHGVTMYCDHVACSADYEVVLPNGDCINTGYGAFPGAKAREVDAWGIGPSLIGLFSQSNLGIVTRATIWLMRAPPRSEVVFFTIDDDAALYDVVDVLRSLRLDRVLKTGPFLGNVYQALQKVITYPWDRTHGAVPLPLDTALDLARSHRYSLWNGSIGLYGTDEEVAVQRDGLARALDGKASWTAAVRDPSEVERAFPETRHREVRSVVAGFTGRVGGTGLSSPYWRMEGPPLHGNGTDLDRDGCGFKFWTAVSPFRGRDVKAVCSVATELLLRYGFEPSIGILPVRERILHYHIACVYDRRVVEHEKAVLECHEELSAVLMDLGYYPTRLGVGSMSALRRADPSYLRVLSAIKQAIDPQGVLAPGRYDGRYGDNPDSMS